MNTKYYTTIFFFFLFLIMSLICGTGKAQDHPFVNCKARVKANKAKLFQFDSYTVIESEYQINNNRIHFMHKGSIDSIRIFGADKLWIASLKASKDGRILSPVCLSYVANGRSLSDSIVPEEEVMRKSHTYYEGLLYSNAVMSMQDHEAGTTLYYGIGGKDSLSIAKVKGKSREMTWYRDDGMDTLLKRWNEDGNLEYERKQGSEKIWNADQNLIQHTFDSLVQQKWWVRCRKIWYPNGVLSSVTYHYGKTPCLTWKYYNEQGKLTRQVKHKPLKGSPVGYGVGIIPQEPMIFRSVYQKEAVSELFNKDLNSRLALLMCHANVGLEGIYRVQVDLSETGRLTLKEIEGLNAAQIREEMAAFFKETQPVKTAVRNGRPYAQVLQLILKVIPKEK